MHRTISRPQIGESLDGLRPAAFDYWRVGAVEEAGGQLDFWIERAGDYKCKRQHRYSMQAYQVNRWTRVFFVVEGSAEFQFETTRLTVRAGDFLVVPPNHPSSYYVEKKCRYHWFALAGKWPQVWGAVPRVQHLAIGNDLHFVSLFENLRELLILQPGGYALSALSLFYAILARIEALQMPLADLPSTFPEGVRKAMIYMKEHHTNPFHAPTLAAAVNLSESHLRALFNKCTGESPRRYHTRCRIDRAMQLFQTQRLPIKTVAGLVGYDDVGHFSRVFKKLTQSTPTQYLHNC